MLVMQVWMMQMIAQAQGFVSWHVIESTCVPRSQALSSCLSQVGRAVDALKVLAQQQVSAELLARTEAGKRLKKLTKHSSSKVCEAAAAAIDAWKECVRKEQAAKEKLPTPQPFKQEQPGPSSGATQPTAGAAGVVAGPSKLADSAAGEAGNSRASQEPAGGEGPSTSGSAGGKQLVVLDPPKTGDETRDKIRKLIAEALAMAQASGVQGDPCAAAVGVEEAMHTQNGGVTQKYKAKYRNLAFNLKDPKNPDLRAKVSEPGSTCCGACEDDAPQQ